MNDQERLLGYIAVFEDAIDDFVGLARDLQHGELDLPTDLAGWTVHDNIAHTAHLEAVLAGAPEETVAVPEGLEHVRGLMGTYTEQGVIARRDRSRDELLDEIETSVHTRLTELRESPPSDAKGSPPRSLGGVGWDFGTLLSNRPFDVWMHGQDIRRATGRTGGLDTAGARHALGVFDRGFPYVLGKRVAAPAGTTAAIELTDRPHRVAAMVGDDGRGSPVPGDAEAGTTLRMSTESYIVLSGGRRAPESQQVETVGDPELGSRILAAMAVTP